VSTGIVWFRSDLRLTDNPAWASATAEHEQVVPLFVVDPALWDRSGGRRRQAEQVEGGEDLGRRGPGPPAASPPIGQRQLERGPGQKGQERSDAENPARSGGLDEEAQPHRFERQAPATVLGRQRHAAQAASIAVHHTGLRRLVVTRTTRNPTLS